MRPAPSDILRRYQGKVSRISYRADAAFTMPGVYEFLEAVGFYKLVVKWCTLLQARRPTRTPVQPASVVEYGRRRIAIIIGVMLAALLQTLDTTITNVALPNPAE